MLSKSILPVIGLVAFVTADYHCSTNLGKFTIKDKDAKAAFEDGGTATNTGSGFPHAFGGGSGSNAQLKFLGADPKCNEKSPKLLEYPVFKDGKRYDKNSKHGTTETPARVVYLQDGKTLCGVMTHVIEDKKDHHGSGDFRVCDK